MWQEVCRCRDDRLLLLLTGLLSVIIAIRVVISTRMRVHNVNLLAACRALNVCSPAAATYPPMFPTENFLKVVEDIYSISMDQVVQDCPHQNTQIFVSQKEIQ